MGASVTARNQALDGIGGSLPGSPVNTLGFVSLHTADPGTTGANENPATGGYAAQACAWNNASAGSKTNSSTLTFADDGAGPLTHFATRNQAAAAGATHGVSGALSSQITATSITVAPGALTVGVS